MPCITFTTAWITLFSAINVMSQLTRLGKYEIKRELGRGAMGVVYEAIDPLIQRTVAIKTILKSSVDKSEEQEAFKRLRHEAQAVGRLAHPKIVAIYEYGEDAEKAFIVMELIRGKELKEYFDREERFGIKDGIRIVWQLLDALGYSHSRGVVHRDIKPANILVSENGQIKVADFGIAKIESTNLTQVGMVLGTPAYMSPEQFIGLEVDHRTDLYSAGVILYQFLTGDRPFTGSVISIMHKAASQEAAPPSQINPEVSKALDKVIKKALAKRADDRFQTAAEFMEALKAAEMSAATDSPIVLPGGTASKATSAEARAAEERRKKELVEAKRQNEAAEKALFAQKIAEIRREAAENMVKAEAQRKKNAQEQARRAQELAGVMAGKQDRLTEVMAEREAEREAQRKMEAEAKQKLEARIKRKQEAEKQQAQQEKELAEARRKPVEEEPARREPARRGNEYAEANAGAEVPRQRGGEEQAHRQNELAEGRSKAQHQREAADQARRSRVRTIALVIGVALAIGVIVAWYAMNSAPAQVQVATKPEIVVTPPETVVAPIMAEATAAPDTVPVSEPEQAATPPGEQAGNITEQPDIATAR